MSKTIRFRYKLVSFIWRFLKSPILRVWMIHKETEYGWYLCLNGKQIVGGLYLSKTIFTLEKILLPSFVLFI